MTEEKKQTVVDIPVELDLERLTQMIVDKTSKIVADKISESMLTGKTDWSSFPITSRPVLSHESQRIMREWLDEHKDLIIDAAVEKVSTKLMHSNPIRERVAQLVSEKVMLEGDAEIWKQSFTC